MNLESLIACLNRELQKLKEKKNIIFAIHRFILSFFSLIELQFVQKNFKSKNKNRNRKNYNAL